MDDSPTPHEASRYPESFDYLRYKARVRNVHDHAWIEFELVERRLLDGYMTPLEQELNELVEFHPKEMQAIYDYEGGMASAKYDVDIWLRWTELANRLHVLGFCRSTLDEEHRRRKVTNRDLYRFIGVSLVDLRSALAAVESRLLDIDGRLNRIEDEIVPNKMALSAVLKDVRRSSSQISSQMASLESALGDFRTELSDLQIAKKSWWRS